MDFTHWTTHLSFGGIILISLVVATILHIIIYRVPIRLYHEWFRQATDFLKQYKDPDPTVTSLFSLKSGCPNCQTPYTRWRFLPVFGYLFIKNGCKQCGLTIKPRIYTLEIVVMLLSMLVFYRFGATPILIPALLFTWLLIALAFIDKDHHLLPDNLVYMLLWLGLFVNLFQLFTPISHAVLGVFIGYLILRFPSFLYRLLRGFEGMGSGDFKLMAALCSWFGYQAILPLLLVAVPLNFIIYIIRYFHPQWRHKQEVPFGPSLAIAGWIYLLFGNVINDLIAKKMGIG